MRVARLLLPAFVVLLALDTGVRPSMTPPQVVGQALTTDGAYTTNRTRFEQNTGLVDAQVHFLARGRASTLFLTSEGATLSLRAPSSTARCPDERGEVACHTPTSEPTVLRMKVVGGHQVVPRPEQKLVTRSNYFVGNDPSKWRTDVPNFGSVVYPGVLDGVDLVYHGEEGQLEYDFVVAPGVDSRGIELDVSGAEELSLTDTGALAIRTTHGVLVQPRPRVYQKGPNGQAEDVSAQYRLLGHRSVGFEVAAYDRARELVIDPVLEYSTYLGGSLTDTSADIAVNASVNAYVTGDTASLDFPTLGAFQSTPQGSRDVFVAKLGASGGTVEYATYVGGSSADDGAALTIDAAGNAYVTGTTYSTNFPVLNAFQTTLSVGGTFGNPDAFVLKLSPAGNTILYSTYVGGASSDFGVGIAVDGLGSAYVSGRTRSANFPVLGAFQASLGGGEDGFVMKLSPSGNTLVYSTFLGGTDDDFAARIKVDAAGSAYVNGSTESTNFPTQSPIQAALSGNFDAFVTKLSPSGSALTYSTYLGGSERDFSGGIALDASGSAYISGQTDSPNFPTKNPFQPAMRGAGDAFVAKLAPAGTALVYSSFLGGTGFGDRARAIAVDGKNSAYVFGHTASKDFPQKNAIQTPYFEGFDLFVTKVSPGGEAIAFSTYLGAAAEDLAGAVALDNKGGVYLTGNTKSVDFPSKSALQPAYAGSFTDGYVAKVFAPDVVITPATATVSTGATLVFAASGGSGKGYVYSLRTNASGATVDSVTGAYKAGPNAPGSDSVLVTDSEGTTADAQVTVTLPVQPTDGGTSAGDGGVGPTADGGGSREDGGARPSDAAPSDAVPSDTGGTAGCGCHTTPAATGTGAGTLVLAMVGALTLRRRRRQR